MGLKPRSELQEQVDRINSLGGDSDDQGTGPQALDTHRSQAAASRLESFSVGMLAPKEMKDAVSFSGLNEFEPAEIVLVRKGRLTTIGKVSALTRSSVLSAQRLTE
eukprot:3099391-Rhodomonas_salina.1